jgi:hypothetical protein
MTYDESKVTYLSKSEGGRGEALRAEKRGAGECQGLDRQTGVFKYFVWMSNEHGLNLGQLSLRACNS